MAKKLLLVLLTTLFIFTNMSFAQDFGTDDPDYGGASLENEEEPEEESFRTVEENSEEDAPSAVESAVSEGVSDAVSDAVSEGTDEDVSVSVSAESSEDAESSEEDSDEEGDEEDAESSEEGDDEETRGKLSRGKFKMGFGVKAINVDGETWTRIHLTPEIPIGKFAMAFDFELFLTSDGKFSPKGWEFTSVSKAFDSILRKIYFIRWASQEAIVTGEDHVFFKIGALDNVTLGQGIVMDNYCNTLDYPVHKKLGLQFGLGNISPLRIGFNFVFNDFNDLLRKGAILGGRLFMYPLAPTKKKYLSKLQIGVTYMIDINQYSGLRDRDRDNRPDLVDNFPDDHMRWDDTDGDGTADYYDSNEDGIAEAPEDADLDGDQIADYNQLTYAEKLSLSNYLYSTFNLVDSVDMNISANPVFNTTDVVDPFGMIGIDLFLPLPLGFSLYGQMGINHDITNEYDPVKAKGWGLIGPGIGWGLKKFVQINFEYRKVHGDFMFNYFDREYEDRRAFLNEYGSISTKDSTIGATNLNGVYGSLTVNMFLLYGFGSYQLLVAEDFQDSLMDLNIRFYLNKDLLHKIPVLKKVLGDVEAYLYKKNISVRDITSGNENFFGPSVNLVMGVRAEIILFGFTKVTYEMKRTYMNQYNSELNDFELVPDNKFSVGMTAVF